MVWENSFQFFESLKIFTKPYKIYHSNSTISDPRWPRLKNPENPEISGIDIGIWKPRKNPEWKIPKISKFREFFRDFRGFFRIFLYFGIFIPRIRNFFGSRDCKPRNSGFFFISGFLPSGYPGRIFYLRDRDFFSWYGIFRQKPTLLLSTILVNQDMSWIKLF